MGRSNQGLLVGGTGDHGIGIVHKVDVHGRVAQLGQERAAIDVTLVLGAPDVGGRDRKRLDVGLCAVLENVEAGVEDGLAVERAVSGKEDGALEQRRRIGLLLGTALQQRCDNAGRDTLADHEREIAFLADKLLQALLRLEQAGAVVDVKGRVELAGLAHDLFVQQSGGRP